MSEQTQERVGFEAWLGIKPCGAAHDLAYEAFKAGAAWQRTAAIPAEKPLPELMMASYHEAIGWNACRQALLAAAPALPAERQETVCPDCLDTGRQPGVYGPHKCRCNASAERQEQEELHVWRATTRVGETCHFGEASTARAWAGESGTVERVDLTPVPELRAVERQEQSEVQRLREALEATNMLLRIKRHACEVPEVCRVLDRHIERNSAALAPSTGQEVGK